MALKVLTWVLFLLIGYGIGFMRGALRTVHSDTFGWLRIDKKRDRFRLELNDAIDLDRLPDTKQYVLLEIDPTADLPVRKENTDYNEM